MHTAKAGFEDVDKPQDAGVGDLTVTLKQAAALTHGLTVGALRLCVVVVPSFHPSCLHCSPGSPNR